MADALKAQEQDPAARELSFLERLGTAGGSAVELAENQALARRLESRQAGGRLRGRDRLPRSRGLDKSVIRALTQESAWVAQHENIFVLGPTGVGKSFVACALAQKAAAMATPHSTRAPRRCSAIWPSLVLTEACERCWPIQPHRCAGDRRLGHGAAHRNRAPRLLGDLRRPLPNPVD